MAEPAIRLLDDDAVMLRRTGVRFPIELRPSGVDVSEPTTWPVAEGRLELVEGRLLYMPPCADIQQDVAVDVVHVLRSWSEGHPQFLVGGNEAGMKCRAFFNLPAQATPYFILCSVPQPPSVNRESFGVLDLLGYSSNEKLDILGTLAASANVVISPELQRELVHAHCRHEPGLQGITRLIELAAAERPGEVTMGLVRRHFGAPHRALSDEYRLPTPGGCFSAAYLPSGSAELIIEAARSELPGLRIVGGAGPVMVESVHIARTAANALLPANQRLCAPGKGGVVVNFQGGGSWKKEGASAGLPVALSFSLATDRPLPERVAATGEVSLTGRARCFKSGKQGLSVGAKRHKAEDSASRERRRPARPVAAARRNASSRVRQHSRGGMVAVGSVD